MDCEECGVAMWNHHGNWWCQACQIVIDGWPDPDDETTVRF